MAVIVAMIQPILGGPEGAGTFCLFATTNGQFKLTHVTSGSLPAARPESWAYQPTYSTNGPQH